MEESDQANKPDGADFMGSSIENGKENLSDKVEQKFNYRFWFESNRKLVALVILGLVLGGGIIYAGISQRKIKKEPSLVINQEPEQAENELITVSPSDIPTDTPKAIATATPTKAPQVLSTPIPSKIPTPTTPVVKAVTVSGFAYEDRSNDGLYNSDDPPLPNMQFYLFDTYNSQQVSTVFTDSGGNFSITLNVRGNLLVRPTAYNNFTPKSTEVSLSSSQSGLKFGFRSASAPVEGQNVGIIEGNIYHDSNRNKVRDSGEVGVYFYKLYLKDSRGNYYNTVENAQTTDPGGHFKYINLPVSENYTIWLSNQTGDYEILQAETSISLTHTYTQNTNIEIPVYKN